MTKPNRLVFASPPGLAVAFMSLMVVGDVRADRAGHVRWDIISVAFGIPPALHTVSAGGVAFASADASHTIKLTGCRNLRRAGKRREFQRGHRRWHLGNLRQRCPDR